MATLLDDQAREAALGELHGWSGDQAAISRTVHIDGGPQQMDEFLDKLEVIARDMNHDPDTEISGDDLTIVMSTHSAGGVTDLDIEYARRVDALLG
jgi:4a-hydroxytetrahydrobiopterin dehydratase